MRVAFVIPAYRAELSIGEVVRGLGSAWRAHGHEAPCRVLVVDDGSDDRTALEAERAGAELLRHAANRGKGAALRSGLGQLSAAGFEAAVSLDADGQHPAEQALRLAQSSAPRSALLLGVRDLVRAGAPLRNRRSNAFANWFLSLASGRPLSDTQCGLRRYPLPETLALGARAQGFGFETEILLRAVRLGMPIEELPVEVLYPPDRRSHFHAVRDPARIVGRVLHTLVTAPRRP